MRTTVTLDPDVEVLVRKAMRERRLSFKAALNQAVRDGLIGKKAKASRAFALRTFKTACEFGALRRASVARTPRSSAVSDA